MRAIHIIEDVLQGDELIRVQAAFDRVQAVTRVACEEGRAKVTAPASQHQSCRALAGAAFVAALQNGPISLETRHHGVEVR